MNNPFIQTIKSTYPAIRNRSFYSICRGMSTAELIPYLDELDEFRKQSPNLYDRVRASVFLYAGYRFFLQESKQIKKTGFIDPVGFLNLLNRNYEKAISIFNSHKNSDLNANTVSCLAECYHKLTFQILTDQVKRSVKSNIGNKWMFRVGHPDEHPLRFHPAMLNKGSNHLYPVLRENTPVRMDLTHSCWSDIFFLGMDYPEGARVINVSIDLGVFGRDKDIKPPVESYFRVITEPVIRLTSIDLNDTKDIVKLHELFDFGSDYLGLLKAGIIASGLVPPSFEGTNHKLEHILNKILAPGLGIELVTKVNDIPKGSRLAVSTNLLASIISVIMRATYQTNSLEGELSESDRRVVASRAILGEWLGGSGGGWQDSGGIWPGVKSIEGVLASDSDIEFNVSRGCLLPKHFILSNAELHPEFEERITSSLVLMHGGMASNVGPILELVTEKYLLRSEKEWLARQQANSIYDEVFLTLREGDIKKLARLTSINFNDPIKIIIPWATTHFTEVIIERAKEIFGENYWGFLMLGGMSGGGMGMFVDPSIYVQAKEKILELLVVTKNEMKDSLPFAMEPVVYNFKINKNGSFAVLLRNQQAILPFSYYSIMIPLLSKKNKDEIPEIRKIEVDYATALSNVSDQYYPMLRSVVGSLFAHSQKIESAEKHKYNLETEKIKNENGFDRIQHEQIRQDLIKGRIGLARNRLPLETVVEDVKEGDLVFYDMLSDNNNIGYNAIKNGKVAVFCLAAGVGSRWTKGAGVIKAVNPFVIIDSRHRSFLETHIAKVRKTSGIFNSSIPFIIAANFLTYEPIKSKLTQTNNYNYKGKVYLSPGKSIGQRFIPMERDLHILWEDMPEEILDEYKEKVRSSLRRALIDWVKAKGEGSDYSVNIAMQRLSPLGHWYEFPNLLKNGTLARLLKEYPDLENILLHNIDTLGANLSKEILNYHIESGNALTFEVIPRRIEDRGGGLARVNGKVRLLEGLAQPKDENELGLSFYNSMSTWINIDKILAVFNLDRNDLFNGNEEKINQAIRIIARRMPTYVTIKEVKYRWGYGQEDIYPVAQIEKLWSDMTSLPDLLCGFVAVPRCRGQQLKDPSQLDSWIQDGSKDYVQSLCSFE